MNPLRLLVAVDEFLLREGLCRMIDAWEEATLVGVASRAVEALALCREVDGGDALLLGCSGGTAQLTRLLEGLRAACDQTPVLVLGRPGAGHAAHHALRAGATGVLGWGLSEEELRSGIRRAARREPVGWIEGGCGGPTRTRGMDRIELSAREREVLRLLCAGRSLKEIGAELGLSPKTVSTYRSRALQKLGLRSTADLVRYALEHGLTNNGAG